MANLTTQPYTLVAGVEVGHVNMAQVVETMDEYAVMTAVSDTNHETVGTLTGVGSSPSLNVLPPKQTQM